MPKKKGGTVKAVRDTRFGDWVKKEEAKKRPDTTVTKTSKKPKKKK